MSSPRCCDRSCAFLHNPLATVGHRWIVCWNSYMSLDQLRDLLDRHVRPDGSTAIDGVRICRADHAVRPETAMSGTVLAIIAHGDKRLALGDRIVACRA